MIKQNFFVLNTVSQARADGAAVACTNSINSGVRA